MDRNSNEQDKTTGMLILLSMDRHSNEQHLISIYFLFSMDRHSNCDQYIKTCIWFLLSMHIDIFKLFGRHSNEQGKT